ncbi:hypothetical protein V6N13_084371 [Hibiscus sabdariffa]
MGTKRLVSFKRLMKRDSWKWKSLVSAFKWKRLSLRIGFSFIDDLIFKVVSVFEAIFLVSTLWKKMEKANWVMTFSL